MADSIRERIIQAVITRLAVIKTSGGYNTNIGNNVLRARKNLDISELPCCVVWAGVENADRKYGKNDIVMPIKIEGFAAFETSNPSVVAELILADLIKGLTSADCAGGLAIDVIYVQGGVDSYPESGEQVIGVNITININYLTAIGNPYS